MGLLSDTIREHPEELLPLLRVQRAAKRATRLPQDPDLAFCYDMLNRVSRSFALVIQQLGPQLRDPVCVFYLVLRALDTVEDDMAIPVGVKLPLLNQFSDDFRDPEFKFVCGSKDYKRLMERLHHVRAAFFQLHKPYQAVIVDITKRMGQGMAKFIETEVETVAQYDEYCHYVAGLVGIGLSDLFYAAKLEEPVSEAMSNSMGLFLQKTNIIRDYLEDIVEEPQPRMFWPKEIWGKYAKKLEDFKDMPGDVPQAVACLNELIVNALGHAMDCLKYLERLQDVPVFRFCAIPQVMAMGTLALCYGNVDVFRGVVKLRRGLTAKIVDRTKNMADVYNAFAYFAAQITEKIKDSDPTAALARQRAGAIQAICLHELSTKRSRLTLRFKTDHTIAIFLVLFCYLLIVSFIGAIVMALFYLAGATTRPGFFRAEQ